jgi:hypothetical protein
VPGQATPPVAGPVKVFSDPYLESGPAITVPACRTSVDARVNVGRIVEAKFSFPNVRPSGKMVRLRLWFAGFAYVVMAALRRIGLGGTEMSRATCGTIRLKLLKIGALITISVRRVKIAFASSCPHQAIFAHAHHRLRCAAA